MIELLEYCGGDNQTANVARVSFAGKDWGNLPEDYTVEQRDKLIAYLAKHKHTSPFRHNHVSIRCKVPIFIARQLGKHQTGLSWNEVSRRYVKDNFEFFYPDKWRLAPIGSIKQGSGETVTDWESSAINDSYDKLIQYSQDLYSELVNERGIAPEQARMVLPQSMMTEFVWSGNIMAFAHVYKLRIDGHAQKEAQDFAKALNEVISPLFPVSWAALIEN